MLSTMDHDHLPSLRAAELDFAAANFRHGHFRHVGTRRQRLMDHIEIPPTPNANIVSATCGRSRSCAANSDAAPSVGPTQGLQTAPSSAPIENCPETVSL